jgi:spermidine synthase
VCEVDADVLGLAREHLGLRRMPGLKVRHADGRSHLAAQTDGSWDAIVIDAFVGARVPDELISAQTLGDAARVAPMTLVNVVDDRSARRINEVASTMASAYARVWSLGKPAGNTIVAGCAADPQPDLALVAARAAADPSPAQLRSL